MTIDLDETKVEKNEAGLWAGWAAATMAGMAVGHLPALILNPSVSVGITRIIVPLVVGLLIGVAQWFVLRGYIIGSHDWIWNHAGGWVVGYALGLVFIQALGHSPLGLVLGFILFGAIVAVFQWPVLRREIPHLMTWVLANILGWGLGAAAGWAASLVFFPDPENAPLASTLIVNGLTGLVAGAITGLALVWIVRKPDLAGPSGRRI